MTVSPSKEAFLIRIERTLLNKVRREAHSQGISVNKMFAKIVDAHDFTGQKKPLRPSRKKPWWK
jgi:hypothetical protein